MNTLFDKLPAWLKLGSRSVLGIPFFWLIVFFALPFLILLRISLTDMGDGIDPFAQMLFNTDGRWRLVLQVENYLSVFREEAGGTWFDTIYMEAYWLSLRYAFATTVLCLVLGYPFAYFIARAPHTHRPIYLMLVMLPFWTSFLLRVYAWKGILADQGVVNKALMAMGLIDEPILMLYTNISMLVGMTYVYLPFMILPLYANLVKMDVRLLEAAYDLGTSPWKAFWLITVPLSKNGIVAGCMLVFIPCVGEFVIPSLLGGADNVMIGRVVWDEMFSANNWPRASALAIIMILVVVLPLLWIQKSLAAPQEEGKR
jgi:putrescine transport system permease protein